MAKRLNIFQTKQEFLDFKNSDSFSNNTVNLVKEDYSVWFGPIQRLSSDLQEEVNEIITNIINTPV